MSNNTIWQYDENDISQIRNISETVNGKVLIDDSITSFGRIISVLLLRIGFILVQVGSIPVENVYLIIFRNIADIALTILCYGFIGYQFSYGKSTINGIISYQGFIGDKDGDLEDAIVGFCSCLIGTAIISSFVVARLHRAASLIVTVLSSSIFIPMLICWVWSKRGWMTRYFFIQTRVAVKDYGGNLVIHAPSAMAGLVGTLVLGRRVVKIKDVDGFSIGQENISGSVTGYFFMLIGYMGFCLPTRNYESNHELSDYISLISINSLMGFAAGILTTCCFQALASRNIYRYWVVVKCLQGGVAGMVTVSAGIDVYAPSKAFGAAALGALCFFTSSNLIRCTWLEDCCNITAIYLICGSVGSLLPPVLGDKENLGIGVSFQTQMTHALWQLTCLTAVLSFSVVVYLTIFGILYGAGILRNNFEVANHQRAKVLNKKLPWKKYFSRKFLRSKKEENISPETNRERMSQSFVT